MKSDFGYLNYKCLKITIAYKRTRPFVRTADLYLNGLQHTQSNQEHSIFLIHGLILETCKTKSAWASSVIGGKIGVYGSMHYVLITRMPLVVNENGELGPINADISFQKH